MAEALSTCIVNIRLLTGERDPAKVAVGSETLRRMCESTMHAIAAEVGYLDEWVTAAITLVTDSGEYNLPTAVQYGVVKALVRNRDGYTMTKRPLELIRIIREGVTVPTGEPSEYALWEDESSNLRRVKVLFDVNVSSAHNGETINMMRSPVPADLSADATNIPLADAALRALERRVAAQCLTMLPDEQLARMGRSRDAAGLWLAEAAELVEAERVRLYRLRHSAQFEAVSPWQY